MNLSTPPTAIMCFSDLVASYVYKTLGNLNLKIPDNVAVMGFGKIAEGEFFQPALSTMSYEYDICWKLSIELLLNANEWFACKKAVPPIIHKACTLIKRKSTAILLSTER